MRYLLPILLVGLSFGACNSQNETTGKTSRKSGVYPISQVEDQYEGLDKATFAGGCFWCTEAVFERVKGVEAVISGYTDGDVENPSYRAVCTGNTGHTEAIRIYFDPARVSYDKLVEVFFATHDPTQLNRQGPDVGTQYRSGVYYHSERQKEIVENYIQKLEKSGKYDKPIVTEVDPASTFYRAEDYHQDYYENNPKRGYLRSVTQPKVEKFEKEFKAILKDKYKA